MLPTAKRSSISITTAVPGTTTATTACVCALSTVVVGWPASGCLCSNGRPKAFVQVCHLHLAGLHLVLQSLDVLQQLREQLVWVKACSNSSNRHPRLGVSVQQQECVRQHQRACVPSSKTMRSSPVPSRSVRQLPAMFSLAAKRRIHLGGGRLSATCRSLLKRSRSASMASRLAVSCRIELMTCAWWSGTLVRRRVPVAAHPLPYRRVLSRERCIVCAAFFELCTQCLDLLAQRISLRFEDHALHLLLHTRHSSRPREIGS